MDRNELYDTMSYLYDIAMENAPSNDVRKFNKSSNKIVNNYANKVIRLSKRINSLLKRIINTFSSVESLTDGSIRTSRITKAFPKLSIAPVSLSVKHFRMMKKLHLKYQRLLIQSKNLKMLYQIHQAHLVVSVI